MKMNNLIVIITASAFLLNVLAIEISAENWKERITVCDSYYKSGNYEEAISCYNESLGLDSSMAETWYKMGLTQSAMGQDAEAQKSFNEAIRRDASYLSRTSKGNDFDIQKFNNSINQTNETINLTNQVNSGNTSLVIKRL
jgi:tetratricopeptide (TPR) repeat protein